MQPDASTNADESEKSAKKSRHPFRASPKTSAILARLRYVGDYLFGGNLGAYAEAVGFSESWLARILSEQARCRVSTFAQFVESGLVSAEWLFCGTGPMLSGDPNLTEIATYQAPPLIRSRYPLFDMTLTRPVAKRAFAPLIELDTPVTHAAIQRCVALAQAVFSARSAHKPVLLFLSPDVVEAGATPIVNALLRQKIVTGLAMTSDAAVLDLERAQKHKNLSALNNVLHLAARNGLGFAEAIGRWGFQTDDARECSILATAYDLNIPATVHAQFGDSALYCNPAIGGARFGADIGATSYVDFLVFAELVAQLAGDPAGVFITTGPATPGLKLLSTAMSAAQLLPKPPRFDAVKIARFSTAPAKKNLDYLITGKYAESFPAFFSACKSVYEGRHNVYSNKRANSIRG